MLEMSILYVIFHLCGPLIIYPASGHEVPILVTPGIDAAEAVHEWRARG